MKEIVAAVHATEVQSLFEGLHIMEDLKAGHLRCHACGVFIRLDNFRAVTRHNGVLKFACDKPACLGALASLGREMSYGKAA